MHQVGLQSILVVVISVEGFLKLSRRIVAVSLGDQPLDAGLLSSLLDLWLLSVTNFEEAPGRHFVFWSNCSRSDRMGRGDTRGHHKQKIFGAQKYLVWPARGAAVPSHLPARLLSSCLCCCRWLEISSERKYLVSWISYWCMYVKCRIISYNEKSWLYAKNKKFSLIYIVIFRCGSISIYRPESHSLTD